MFEKSFLKAECTNHNKKAVSISQKQIHSATAIDTVFFIYKCCVEKFFASLLLSHYTQFEKGSSLLQYALFPGR